MALDEKQVDKDLQELKIQVALLSEKVTVLTKTMEVGLIEMKASYVTKAEFNPIQKVVYGIVSTILVTVIAGIMALIIRK